MASAAVLVFLSGCGSDGSPASAGDEPTAATVATTAPMPEGMDHSAVAGGGADPAADRPSIVDFGGADRAKLGEELAQARAVALRYPTVADATAAGYELTTPYAPGTGAHFGKDADTQPPGKPLDITKPQSYLYDGVEPTSRLVGVMYVQLGGDEAPDGFTGPLDTWSPFPGQCLVKGTTDPVFPTKDSVTKAECDDADGTFLDVTAWIQHVWVVPGWEAPGGVFAPSNADIVCADGTMNSDDTKGCEAPT